MYVALHCTALRAMVWFGMVWYGMVWYGGFLKDNQSTECVEGES